MIARNPEATSSPTTVNLGIGRDGTRAVVDDPRTKLEPRRSSSASASERTIDPPGWRSYPGGTRGRSRRAHRFAGLAGLSFLGAALMSCTVDLDATPGSDGDNTTDDATNPTCLALLYGGSEFTGEGACLQAGTSSLAELKEHGLTQAVLGSVILDPGYRMSVWMEGAAEPWQTVTSDAALALPGQIARVEVTSCLAGLFEGADGHGAGACMEAGFHDAASLAKLGLTPKRTRSMVVASGYRATVAREGSALAPLSVRGSIDLSDDVGGAIVAVEVVREDRPTSELGEAPTVAPKAITSFDHVYVVGDSLSDQQNQRSSFVPRCPNQHLGYWNGRFTNGYNWVDYLTQDNSGLGAKVSNRAVGGSKVLVSAIVRPSLLAQANALIAALPSATRRAQLSNSLVVIWGGANDVKETALARSPGNAVTFGNSVLTQLKVVEDTLYNAGVRNFVFIGVPEINRVPVATAWTTAQRLWTQEASRTINAGLVSFAIGHSHLYVTVPAMINDWLDHRLVSVNMNDTTASCIPQNACDFTSSGTYVEKVCAHKMFFDPMHPTTLAHCGIAKRIEQTLATKYTVSGSTANIETCGQRSQAAAFDTTPARRIRFDVQTSTLSSTSAALTCPSKCKGAGAHWNGNWTNMDLARPLPTPGGTYRVGACGCDK